MKRFFIFIFLCFPVFCFSATVKPTLWFNTVGTTIYNPSQSYFFNNTESACQNLFDRTYKDSGTLISATVSSTLGGAAPGTCNLSVRLFSNGGTAIYTTPVSLAFSCPAGFTLDANTGNITTRTCSSTSCPAGTTLNTSTNRCDDNCAQFKGQQGSFTLNCSGQTSTGSPVCMPNNCAAKIIDSSSARIASCWYGYNTTSYTGVTCAGEPSTGSFSNPSNNPQPVDDDKTNCIKQGQSFGTVNGVTVCVPKSSSGAAPITTSSQSTSTTTNTDTAGNSTSQSSTEVKNVTQDGDQVTSQIIKNNPDGTKTESTMTQSYDDFCASNPNNKICKKASDEDTSSACEDNPDLPQCYVRGEADNGDSIGETTRTVSFAAKSITSASSCPSNKSMSAFGRSLTIDYTPVCTYAADFKPFILAFAYLSAAMFLFWGYKGSQS